MLRTIALWVIVVFFGLLVLAMAVTVLVSVAITLAAVAYRFVPGSNVPLSYSVRNMLVRWKNTLVTATAFTLVIGLLVLMLAFVNGMDHVTQTSGRPGNVTVLKSGATDEGFSDLPANVVADVLRLPEKVREGILRNDKREYLASKEVYIIVNQPIPNAPPTGKQRRMVQMRGIDNPLIAADVHGIKLQEGRWFTQEGLQAIKSASAGSEKKTYEDAIVALGGVAVVAAAPEDRAIEVVLGAGIAYELGHDRPGGPVTEGEMLDIAGRKWIVVGVMARGSSTFGSEIWCRDSIVQELFGRRNSYSAFVVATRDAKSAEKLAKDLKEFKELPVNPMAEMEYYSKLTANNQQFLGAIIIVAIIMAVGGVLGVMNTMYAAISQRAKDIGILRLIGFSRWQILVSFLVESLVIAFAGGVLGCALGALCNGWTATSIVTSGQGGGKSIIFQLMVDAKTIGLGLALTFIMGAVGGLVPALSAMRLRPLESLR